MRRRAKRHRDKYAGGAEISDADFHEMIWDWMWKHREQGMRKLFPPPEKGFKAFYKEVMRRVDKIARLQIKVEEEKERFAQFVRDKSKRN
jgi:hypothetical protein